MNLARTGRVVVAYSQDCVVEDAAGQLHRCATRRKVGKPFCGDYVRFSKDSGDIGAVESIEPRRNLLARPNVRNELRPFAANVDLMIIVVAVEPAFERILIDRYLVLAENLGVEPLIWLNKIDVAGAERRAPLEASLEVYRGLGYAVIAGSKVTGEGIDRLQDALLGKTGILVGQSGVGKSSLIQRLLPDMELRVGALSHASGLGRHTTTETTLYHLPPGGDLIDSPGIRTLRLGHLNPAEIAQGFRELRELAGQCRFRDCRHRGEPGCAVADALAEGRLDRARLESFQILLDSEAG